MRTGKTTEDREQLDQSVECVVMFACLEQFKDIWVVTGEFRT